MALSVHVATPPKIQVCKYCERKLDEDYVDVGACPHCLDTMDDEDYDEEDDKQYYGNIFDGRIEDEY